MMQWLKNIFVKQKGSFAKAGVIIKPAFTIGGVEYFEMENIYNLPYKRGAQAVRVYEEVRMKCDLEYIKAHCTAINNLFQGKEITFKELSKMKQLNDQLLERLNYIVDTDIIYKLAAVVFFDKSESPHVYDEAHGRKKIEQWKKHESVADFFLHEPMLRLLPFLKQREMNFQTYSKTVKEINRLNWASVFGELSESQKNNFSDSKEFYVSGSTLN